MTFSKKLDKRWRHNYVICIFCKRYIGNIPSRHFDVRMTSCKNFIVDFGFRIQKYPLHQIWARSSKYPSKYAKFLHFSIRRHIHNKRLPWQHRRLMRIVVTCKMTPIGIRLNLKNFISISYAVSELSRKVSQGGGGIPPPPRWDRVNQSRPHRQWSFIICMPMQSWPFGFVFFLIRQCRNRIPK